MRNVILLFLLSALAVGDRVTVGDRVAVAQDRPPKDRRDDLPDIRQPVKNWIHFKRDAQEKLVARILGKEARSAGKNIYAITAPSAILYRKDETSKAPAETEVQSRTGTYDGNTSLLDLKGDVIVTSTDGHRLTTDVMRVDCDTRKSSTASPFVMTKPGFRAEGEGFSADSVAKITTVPRNPSIRLDGGQDLGSGAGTAKTLTRDTFAVSTGPLTIVEVDANVEKMTFRENAKLEIFPQKDAAKSLHDTIEADTITIVVKRVGEAMQVSHLEAAGSVVFRRKEGEAEIVGRGRTLVMDQENGRGELTGDPLANLDFGSGVADAPRMLFRDKPAIVILKGPKRARFRQEKDLFQTANAPARPTEYTLTAEGDILVDSQSSTLHAMNEASIAGATGRLAANRIVVTADRVRKEVTGVQGWGNIVMSDVEKGFRICGDDFTLDSPRREIVVNGNPIARIVKAGGITECGRIVYNLATGVMEGTRGKRRSTILLPE